MDICSILLGRILGKEMNNQIKQLAKQYLCHERYSRYGESIKEDYYEFLPEELDEFCKSIVKTCMIICEDVTERNDPAIACYYEIKKHFGIE